MEKLCIDIPLVMEDDILFAHTIDEAIGRHIRKGLIGYPVSRLPDIRQIKDFMENIFKKIIYLVRNQGNH